MLIVLLSLLQSSLLNLFNSDMYHCPQAPEDVALHYWHPNNGWSNPKIQSNQFQLVPLDHNAQLIQVRCVWWDRLQLQVSLSNDLIDCLMMFDDRPAPGDVECASQGWVSICWWPTFGSGICLIGCCCHWPTLRLWARRSVSWVSCQLGWAHGMFKAEAKLEAAAPEMHLKEL